VDDVDVALDFEGLLDDVVGLTLGSDYFLKNNQIN
jgi:hypothetical protein